jgi:hypothetical protein
LGCANALRGLVGIEEINTGCRSASPPMVLLPAPLVPPERRAGRNALPASHAATGTLYGNLTELARRRIERGLHRFGAGELHASQHGVEFGPNPGRSPGPAPVSVLFHRHDHRAGLVVTGYGHHPGAHRGVRIRPKAFLASLAERQAFQPSPR